MTSQLEAVRPGFSEALRFWWKLGWISFGGPAGQISVMHEEVVVRRRWLSERHFLHALNFCMLLPGPEAQQLATYLGWRLHGAKGGIAAGVLFVLPSAMILFGLAWLYMAGGDIVWLRGLFYGLAPAVIAIVAMALRRIARAALCTGSLRVLAVLAFVAIFVFQVSFVVIIALAAVLGWLGGKWIPHQFPGKKAHDSGIGPAEEVVLLPPVPKGGWLRGLGISAICLVLWWLPVLAVGWWFGWSGIHFQQGVFFSKAALVTFGGAYAVLPYVSQMAVEHYGWLNQRQMMAGLGLAESTPGPLIMVLQFVGFVAAWQHPGGSEPLLAASLGAFLTTWVTFVPCFLFVFLAGPHVEALQERQGLASALTGISAAVVGVILNLAIWFAWHAIWPEQGGFDGFVAVAAVGAWLAMDRLKVGVVPTLAACALAGVGWTLV